MATLLKTIRASLAEVNLGLKGDLTMSENMERIVKALATDTVPTSWAQIAYPSLRTLSTWLPDLGRRASQLSEWVASFTLPNSVWISGALLFHLCTAILSTFARMAFRVYGHGHCILGDVIRCAKSISICLVLTHIRHGQVACRVHAQVRVISLPHDQELQSEICRVVQSSIIFDCRDANNRAKEWMAT